MLLGVYYTIDIVQSRVVRPCGGKFSGDWNYYTCLRYRMVGDVQTHIKGIDICCRTDIEEIDLWDISSKFSISFF